MATLATLVVDLTANTGEFQKGMSAAQKITKSTTKSIQTIGKAALGIGVAGIAALGFGFVKLAQKAIPAASDLEESLNKVDVVFGDLSEGVKDFASDAALGLGQSQAQALEAAGTFGNLLTSIGIIPEKAAEMSTGFVTLASDLASFNNASPEETLLALRSALTGEFEPMKRFGVALNQAAVAQKALDMGLIETTADLTPAIKSMAGYALIMEQTTNAQGDFARTSEGLANAQRIVDAQMEDLMATIGSFLLPVAEKFFGFLSSTAMPILNTFGKYIGFVVKEGDPLNDFLADLPGWLKPIVFTIGQVVAIFKDFFESLATGEDAIGDISNLAYYLGQAFGMTETEASDLFFQVQNLIEGLIIFKDRVVEFITPIVEFISNTVTWKDVLIALGIAVTAVIIPAIFGLLAAILPIIAVGAALIAGVTLIRTAWEENWGGIQEKTAAVIAWFQESIPAALEFITNLWEAHGTTIIATVTLLWEGIKSVINSTIEIVKTVIGAALKFVMEIWDEHGEKITKFIQSLWNTIVTIIEGVITIITNVFQAFVNLLKGDWEALGTNLQTIWETLWGIIESVFNTVKLALETAFGILSTILGNIWETLKDTIVDLWETGWSAIEEFFNTTKDTILTTLGDFVDDIISSFTDTDWIQLGKDIIQGMADGIGKMGTVIWDAAKSMAKKAWDSIMNFFGMGSPSKLMMKVGENIVQGLVSGIEDTQFFVEDAMKKAAEGLYSVFGDSMLANSPELLEIWNLMWDEISKSSDETLLELGGGYSDFFDIMGDAFRDGYVYIAGETIEIFDYMVTNAGYLREDIAWIFEAMGIDIGTSLDGISDAADNTGALIYETWTNHMESTADETRRLALEMLGDIRGIWDRIPPGPLGPGQPEGPPPYPPGESDRTGYWAKDTVDGAWKWHYYSDEILPPPPPGEDPEDPTIPLQHGGSFTVPPGYPSDSYFAPLRLTSGEEVRVTPRSEAGRENKELSQIIVYGGLHLHGVEDKESLADELMELRA